LARRLAPQNVVLLAALLVAGCWLGPGGRVGATVTEQVGDLVVARDPTVRGIAAAVNQAQAEAVAIAWIATRDAMVHALVVDQSSRVVGLLEVSDTGKTLQCRSGGPEDDWVILMHGASPKWAHVEALVVVDAASGEVRSGQLAQSN
jgi:hypothetical protein